MKSLIVRVFGVLLAIAVVVFIYYVAIWVLGLLGLHIPNQILMVALVIVGLIAAIYALTGRIDNWFLPPGP